MIFNKAERLKIGSVVWVRFPNESEGTGPTAVVIGGITIMEDANPFTLHGDMLIFRVFSDRTGIMYASHLDLCNNKIYGEPTLADVGREWKPRVSA
jgi:hypothetical protein